MAYTSYATGDALTRKAWAKELAHEAKKATEIFPLIGKTSNSIIQEKTELKKSGGDRITIGLRMQITGDGKTEGETMEGNAESLTTYSDNVTINELIHAVGVKSKKTIDQQRVDFNLREEAKMALTDWWAKRYAVSFFNQVCGNTATSGAGAPSSTKYTGMMAATAPTTGRIIRPNGQTTDEGVNGDTTAIFKLSHIDRAVELANTGGSTDLPPIRPVKGIGAEVDYVIYLHDSQVTSLRNDTSTGQWADISKFELTGGESSKFKSGLLGIYNRVALRKSPNIPHGVHSTTSAAQTSTRRAVFLGAQSAAWAWGSNSGEDDMDWNEELLDHKRNLEVSAQSIWGLKKLVFNSTDFATVVITTYAAHAA